MESRQTSICYIFESNNEGEKVLVMVVTCISWEYGFQVKLRHFICTEKVKPVILSVCKCFNMLF